MSIATTRRLPGTVLSVATTLYCVPLTQDVCASNTTLKMDYHLERLCASLVRLYFCFFPQRCIILSKWNAVLHPHHTLYHFLYLPVYVCNGLFVFSSSLTLYICFFAECVQVIISTWNAVPYYHHTYTLSLNIACLCVCNDLFVFSALSKHRAVIVLPEG